MSRVLLAEILLYQVLQSGVPGANEIILSNMAVVFDRILLDVEVWAYCFWLSDCSSI